jgi:uncharacterized protein
MSAVSEKIVISPVAARRFLIREFALDGFQTLPDVSAALERLEFVQQDSINVCGRIHDLILRTRVANYTPGHLHETLYAAPRKAFEYYFPNLCALPVADYAHFVPAMQRRAATPGRWHGLTPEEIPIAEKLLARLDSDGPMRTRATGTEDGHTTSGWGTRTTVAACVIEKLWLHGRLTVSHRENFERYFDLTERLLPEVANLTPPDEETERAYLMRKRLRAKRLFRPKLEERKVLGAEAFAAVHIEGDSRPWYVLAEDAAALAMADGLTVSETVHLLAPLDPLVYDRTRNQTLFGFEYIWEVYTPAAKRRWGYYVLPILYGDRIIGRVDPKFDRRTKTLTLHSLTLEPNVGISEVREPLAQRLHEYAHWLGAERIEAVSVPSEIRSQF